MESMCSVRKVAHFGTRAKIDYFFHGYHRPIAMKVYRTIVFMERSPQIAVFGNSLGSNICKEEFAPQ